MLSVIKPEPEEIIVLPQSPCEPRKRLKAEVNEDPLPQGNREKTVVEVVIPLEQMESVKSRWLNSWPQAQVRTILGLANATLWIQLKVARKVKMKGKLIKGIKGIKHKKCAGDLLSLSLDTINARLDKLGPISERNFDVTLDDNIKFTAVPRAFLSNHWGGNTQATYPTIRQAMIEKHGLNDFQYPNTVYNPNCPQVPGYAGLMYFPDGLNNPPFLESHEEQYRTITRDKYQALWTYMGQYIRVWSPSLTRSEWLDQTTAVS